MMNWYAEIFNDIDFELNKNDQIHNLKLYVAKTLTYIDIMNNYERKRTR